jgi:hypothetical protein
MTTLAKKLLYKPGAKWFAPNVPTKLKPLFADLELTARAPKEIEFALLFAKNEKELWSVFEKLTLDEASVVWVCYPKGGVDTDLNRDIVARLLEETGLEPTRQIALDDVWSSMRFKVAS